MGFALEVQETAEQGAAEVEERFTLAEGRGWLTLWERRDKVCLEATLQEDGRGLYKAYLIGKQGRFPLGALVPENGTLQLRRTLSRQTLMEAGVWPPQGAEVALAFTPGNKPRPYLPEGWLEERSPARLMGDQILAQAARSIHGVLRHCQDVGFRLAFPWPEGTALPMSPLFCFAHIQRLGGQRYAVFWFDGQGRPCLPL